MARFKIKVTERDTQDITRLAALLTIDVTLHSPRDAKRRDAAPSRGSKSRAERPLSPLSE